MYFQEKHIFKERRRYIKVRVKLVISFVIVALPIGTVGINSLKNVGENAKKMYTQNLRMVYILTDSKQSLTQIKSDLADDSKVNYWLRLYLKK